MPDPAPASDHLAPAIFQPDGDLYVPTHLAQGPWFPGAQHGGAAVGLAAFLAEREPSAVPMQPVRITTELFRQVPLEPLRPRITHIREGKRIQLLQVSLLDAAESVEYSRSTVLRIRYAPGEISEESLPERPAAQAVPEFWDESARVDISRLAHIATDTPGYAAAFELRSRRDIDAPVSVSWWRMFKPLVDGFELTPFVRLAATADYLMSAGGLLAASEGRVVSINPDLTVYVHHLPVGEWIGVRSLVSIQTDGIGVTAGELFDREILVANANKSLLTFKRE